MKRALLLAFAVACSSSRAAGILPAEQAAAHVGETATVEFTVVQVGHSRDSTFLNSQRYERGGGNDGFVAFIPGAAKDAFQKKFGDDLRVAFEGRKVRVTGALKDYKGAPEIVLNDPQQLELLHP